MATMTKKQREYLTRGWHLDYTQGTSKKFYEVLVTETGVCILRWGRIGTKGQSTATRHATYEDAMDVGLRQVFAKKSKGYSATYADLQFQATEEAIEFALNGVPDRLAEQFRRATTANLFEGLSTSVLKHYEEFAERVKGVMDRAADAELEDSLEQFTQLEEVWAKINDHHAEVEIAMDVAKRTMAQKLMGGL